MPRRIKRRSELAPRHARTAASLHRLTSRERGYDADWDRVARQRRVLDRHLCQRCLAADRLTPGDDVDHIVPLHVRADWRLELGNTQLLCRPHHRRKTTEDNDRYGSSTAPTLSPPQQAARDAARLLQAPTRGWGGPRFSDARRRVPRQLTDDGLDVVAFGQGYASMSAPTKKLEELVLSGRLRHGGHAVLRWMAPASLAGCRVDRDRRGGHW